MKVTIKFYSNWAIGSGTGGKGKDSIVLLDDNCLPFLPGKTFKGLVRDAFVECGNTNDDTLRLFGQEKNEEIEKKELKNGTLRFNSAYLPENFQNLETNVKDHLFGSKTATRLEANKQAKDNSLRKKEICIPVELHTYILVQETHTELEDEDYNKIAKTLKMLKFLGKKRHRGLGRCAITTVDGIPDSNSKIGDKDTVLAKKPKEITKKIASFICKVTEPLILVKKEKSGQNTDSLDYIPGNTFRGIVAGAIAQEKCFNDIIFNNIVQFGDAHLRINNKRSLKTPFSFFYDKNTDDEQLYNFHHLSEGNWITKKLKSQKEGYLIETEDGNIMNTISYGNRIKSSRNRVHRSSEDGGMFSYHYIKKGQEFEFDVTSTNTEYLTKIITILNGKTKYFGKSKTAEFGGAIEIKFSKEKNENIEPKNGKYLYAESNMCFLNKYGEFTATPSAEDLTGDANNEIDWENSQIKFRTYSPYNLYRQNYDFERLIIEKGSVFVFKEDVEFCADFLKNKIGCFKTEGFGNVLVSPSFLLKKEVNSTKEIPNSDNETNSETKLNSQLVKVLQNKHLQNTKDIEQDKSVNEFSSKKYIQGKPSQWARVYNATTKAADYKNLKFLLSNEGGEKDDRDQSIFTGGLNNWKPNDIDKINDFLSKNKENGIIALRKLSKKMIAITKEKAE